MLDELREEASKSPFILEEEAALEFEEQLPPRPPKYFLGMSPAQRFFIALMLLMMTCLLGVFFLLVTERVVPSVFF